MKKIKEIQYISVNENETIIVNLLNGLADVINKETEILLKQNDLENISQDIIDELIDRNYIFCDEASYDGYLKNIYEVASYYEKRENPNFLFIPSYDCNLCCTYCYQRGYKINESKRADNVVKSFFNYVENKVRELEKANGLEYSNKDIVITLMGGEPLQLKNKEIINKFIENCVLYGYKFDIVTNGMTIKDFVDIISVSNLKNIQITVDGAEKVHDKRRIKKDGSGSFKTIIESVMLLISLDIDVYLRINIDNENIDYLPDLAYELKPFYTNKCFHPYIFLLEHEGCMEYKNVLVDYIALEKIYKIQKTNQLLKNIDIAYIGKEIVDGIFSDEVFYPTTRKCSSSKNQYIYDLYGNVYKCWWGVGNTIFRINKFDENLSDNLWKSRQISKIKECNSCKYRFLCGGGCVGRKINDERVDVQKGECHDYEKILDIAIKEKYNEQVQKD